MMKVLILRFLYSNEEVHWDKHVAQEGKMNAYIFLRQRPLGTLNSTWVVTNNINLRGK